MRMRNDKVSAPRAPAASAPQPNLVKLRIVQDGIEVAALAAAANPAGNEDGGHGQGHKHDNHQEDDRAG